MRLKKYWTDSRSRDGHGGVEKEDLQSYRRSYMIGKSRGEEEEDRFN